MTNANALKEKVESQLFVKTQNINKDKASFHVVRRVSEVNPARISAK